MEIVDIQVHTGPAKEGWLDRQQAIPYLLSGDAFPIEAVLIAVDAVGISRVEVDGPDDYGQAAARRFPSRVAWCAHFDRKAPNIAELIGGAAVPGMMTPSRRPARSSMTIGPTPFVGHVRELRPGHRVESLRRKMHRAVRAATPIASSGADPAWGNAITI